jgi:ribokinase
MTFVEKRLFRQSSIKAAFTSRLISLLSAQLCYKNYNQVSTAFTFSGVCDQHNRQRQTSITTTKTTTTNHFSKMFSNSNDDTSKRIPHVVVVGSANYDLTIYTATVPKLGETVLGTDFRTSCGGKGANQAIAAASLGSVKTTMVCRLGNDVFGQELLSNFKTNNVFVDTATCLTPTVPTSSGVACITVDTTNGDNSIIVAPGANSELLPVDVRRSLLQLRPTVVLVQLEISYDSALEALKVGKELGAITILNPAPAPLDSTSLNNFYQYVDIIVPNESELRTLCCEDTDADEEQMGQQLLDKGVRMAVIATLGARGALLIARNKDNLTPSKTYCSAPVNLPCKDEPIIDTIGAGDGFCGSLASYLSSSVAHLPKAIELACGFASMSIRRCGASYPKSHET